MLDVEKVKKMNDINSKSRLKLLRYRVASKLMLGNKRTHYKTKYQEQQNLFAHANKDKWYFFGFHIMSKFSLSDFDYYEFLGIPLFTRFHSLAEKRHAVIAKGASTSPNLVRLSHKETQIYSLIRFWADRKADKVMNSKEKLLFNRLLKFGYVPKVNEETSQTKSYDPGILRYNVCQVNDKITMLENKELKLQDNIAVFGVLPPEQSGIANYNQLLFLNDSRFDLFCFDREYINFHHHVEHGENVYPYCIYDQFEDLYKLKIFILGNSTHNVPYLQMAVREKDKNNSWLYLHEARLIDFIFAYFQNENKTEELKALLKYCYPDSISNNVLLQPLNKVLEYASKHKIYGLRIIHRMTGISNIIVNNDCARELVEAELKDYNVTVKKAFHPVTDLKGILPYKLKNEGFDLYIGSFGGPSDKYKQTYKVVQATVLLNKKYNQSVKLILAGYGVDFYYQGLTQEEQSCVIPFDSPTNEELFALMKLTRLGVQLRPSPHGESSGVICQLLGLGKRSITTEGFIDSSFSEYSKTVPQNVTYQELAKHILDSLQLPDFDNDMLIKNYSFDVLKEKLPKLLVAR